MIDLGLTVDHARGDERARAWQNPFSSLLARLRLVKFSVNVEHARVNKQPSHLHDCRSVTQCLPRQRYRAAPRRIKAYPTVTYRQIRCRGWEEQHGKGGRENEALVTP